MESKICLDTSTLIELIKGDKKIREFVERTTDTFATTAINAFEIWYGRKSTEDVSKLLENLKIYDFDCFSAKIASNILRELRKQGILLEIRDVFIASICIANNLKLVTLDKHFKRLKKFGLKVEFL